LRPPAVYGSGHTSSFTRLAKLAATGIPLPLALVRNRRSFIYIENLADVIATCLRDPKSFGRVHLPSDGEDVSTPELISKIAVANESFQCSALAEAGLAKPRLSDSFGARETHHSAHLACHSVRLFAFPELILKAAGRLPGLGALQKLTASLYVDSAPLLHDLRWTPPFTMAEGLRRTLSLSSNS
jgi:nucleoside-diphosphate-sugar epimerase